MIKERGDTYRSMNKYICIHGHFYQPPRENPWLEEIENQESAYPYHDWNERITLECYAPNATARLLNHEKKIIDIINNYTRISFNFGPTLLSWMERKAPQAYQNILKSDQESVTRFGGHGSALAQCYNHMIMPLANERDKYTQVYWGLKDFEYRFQRKPEGMWLPETAVDLATLDIMAQLQIKFCILAPHQARQIRKLGEDAWIDVSQSRIDPRRPYLCRLPSGATITIFFYDGPISRDVAFADLLNDGQNFINRLLGAFDDSDANQLVHIATDGETYGHHHKMGDMALAYLINELETGHKAQITNYGEYLENNQPDHEVEIFENTSWSCVHGIERWRHDCGCQSGSHMNWHQQWRHPLREAMDWLRDEINEYSQPMFREYCDDDTPMRNEYISVILNRDPKVVEEFVSRQTKAHLSSEKKSDLLKLLEVQRHAMYMYTSCGWFFDDISGIETIQILLYAARAMQLMNELGHTHLEKEFRQRLRSIPCNDHRYANGCDIYDRYVKKAIVDLKRVGVHYAISCLFEDYPQEASIYCYQAESTLFDKLEKESLRMVIGKAKIRSTLTWEEKSVDFISTHISEHEVFGGVDYTKNEEDFAKAHERIKRTLAEANQHDIEQAILDHFGPEIFTLRDLFKDEQAKILYQMLDTNLADIERQLRSLNEHHYPIIKIIRNLHVPLPKVLVNTVLVLVNNDILRVLGQADVDFKKLRLLVKEIKQWSLEIDKVTIGFVFERKITKLMEFFIQNNSNLKCLRDIVALLALLQPLELPITLWEIQNQYFKVSRDDYIRFEQKAHKGDRRAKRWVTLFNKLGVFLNIQLS